MIMIKNHGQIILDTNYWGSPMDKKGKIFCSVNAGAIRVLLPKKDFSLVGEFRSSEYVIVSRGPWQAAGVDEAVEILFEDKTESPFCLHLCSSSFDILPSAPEVGQGWMFSVWVLKKGKPHKALERICKWRKVPQIPYLKTWCE